MSAAILTKHLKSYGLELASDPHKHRKVAALRRLSKGSIVITSRPLCNPVIFPTHRSQYCETCFRSRNSTPMGTSINNSTTITTTDPASFSSSFPQSSSSSKQRTELERCSLCKKRYYCDRGCFTIAWKGWHRWICADRDKEMEDLDHEMLKMVVMSLERLKNGTYKESEDAEILWTTTTPTTTTTTVDGHGSNGNNNNNINNNSQGERETLALTTYVFSTLLGHEAVSDPVLLTKYKEIATRVRDQLISSSSSSLPSSSPSSKFVFKSEESRGNQGSSSPLPPPVSELVPYLCRFHCNNFSIHDAQLFTLAEGTFPIGALFNHSCRPNAIVMYEGKVQIVRALEDIEPGQEVCTSYVDNGVQRLERRQLLKDKYFFDCCCPRCEDHSLQGIETDKTTTTKKKKTGFRILDDLIEGDQDGEDGKKKINGEWLTHQFDTIILPGARSLQVVGPSLQPPSTFTRASFTSYILHSLVPLIQTEVSEHVYTDRLFEIFKVLQETPHCRPKPFTTTVMTNATSFFNTCLEHQSWTLASKIGTFILAMYLMIYPRHHPLIGLHCFTLAKSLWNDVEGGGLTSVRLSHEMLKLARNILKVSHGTTTTTTTTFTNLRENEVFVQEVESFMKTVEMELGS